ncbi:hypothetical protein B296_00058063 [Ensete ventricosum]|uniref:Uncharacterized protein n=1 Tax=Ensete ventricosum TaxID=4639 RepID=A0A426XNM7_ENSVE|nr:hypothetical protein B296_00058063 [Ensete ventricosum]
MHEIQPRGGGRSRVTFVFSTFKRKSETEYPSSVIYLAEELCLGLKTLRRNLIEDRSRQILTNSKSVLLTVDCPFHFPTEY